jgi:hypothetical protein
LISSDEHLSPDDEVTACGVVEAGSIEGVDLDRIVFPKGKLIIQAKQGDNIYLAATARWRIETKTVYRNPLSPTDRMMHQFWGTPEQVERRVPEEVPARVNPNQSLKIEMSPDIQIGDPVCIEDD